MKIIALCPDDQGIVQWPTLSATRKAIVTLGTFDGMHKGHQEIIARTVKLAAKHNAISVVLMMDPRPEIVHKKQERATLYTPSSLDMQGKYSGEGEITSSAVESIQDVKDAKVSGGGAAVLPAFLTSNDPEQLMSVDQRLRLMNAQGVDYVIILKYTLEFSRKSYRFFLGQLVGKLGMRTLVLGSDAAFGAGRAGTVETIRTFTNNYGLFEVDVVDDHGPAPVWIPQDGFHEPSLSRGEPIDPTSTMTKVQLRVWSKAHQAKLTRNWSASHVRYLLSQGRIREANAILGHAHALRSRVVHGEERGRTLGFPTANLGSHIEGYVPADGVYAGWLIDLSEHCQMSVPSIPGEIITYNNRDDLRYSPRSPWRKVTAISIGTNATFARKDEQPHASIVEAHVLGEDSIDLYGHYVRIELTHCIRPHIAFDTVDDLTAAMREDVVEVAKLMNQAQ